MVRPVLEYGSSVCDPHYDGLNDELEKVQNRAARFMRIIPLKKVACLAFLHS